MQRMSIYLTDLDQPSESRAIACVPQARVDRDVRRPPLRDGRWPPRRVFGLLTQSEDART